MQKNTKYLQKNLHISKKCSTFAPAFDKFVRRKSSNRKSAATLAQLVEQRIRNA